MTREEEILKIIIEKRVDVGFLSIARNLYYYNLNTEWLKLTEREFDLIREYGYEKGWLETEDVRNIRPL